MDENELIGIIDQIDGWLTHKEGILLYQLAKNCTGKGVIVEIGSWKGKSTVCMGLGSKEGQQVKIYAVDHHTGSVNHKARWGKIWTYDEFIANITRYNVADFVIPLIKTSAEAAQDFSNQIELLFIDGDHEYGNPQKDFDLWSPRLISGGIIAFHDATCWPEPKAVVTANLSNSRYFKEIGVVDSIVYTSKL